MAVTEYVSPGDTLSAEDFGNLFEAFFSGGTVAAPSGTSGVFMHPVSGPGGKFAATGATSPVAVDTGWAMVANKIVYNSASVDVTVATPAVSARKDRIVLRFTWATETADILLIQSAEGAGDYADYTTAAYQTDGTAWTIPLWKVDITTGGAITLTDERTPVSGSFYILNANIRDSAGLSVLGRSANTTGDIADITAATDGEVLRRSGTAIGFGTVANAGIRDSAGLSVLGRSANTTGDIADITSGADHQVLRREGATVGFGTIPAGAYAVSSIAAADIGPYVINAPGSPHIATGGVGASEIANDAVGVAAIGTMVPGFLGRQGGSATDWSTSGTSNYTTGLNVRLQCGVCFRASSDVTIVFPIAFSDKPLVVLTGLLDSASVIVQLTGVSATQFSLTASTTNVPVHWIAIGPE